MASVATGHYSGRLKEGIEKANTETRGRDGAFYKLLNSSDFYDIDDENNGLLDWQRASVPKYNQRRMSALATAISDMIADFLSNENYGVMVPLMEEIVNKLDQRSTMNKGSIDALGTSMAAIPGGQGGAPAAQAMEQMIAAAMGGNPFDPDMLPPFAIGFAGLAISIASCFKAGFFKPNWEFLYEHEPVKSNGFYAGPDGTPYIGAGIPTTIGGGKCNRVLLNMIFSVPTVDENGNPQGDTVNGVSLENFKLIVKASECTMAELNDAKNSPGSDLYDVANFTLTDGQMRASYFKYIQITLWGTICNEKNWAYLHWGCITNNAIPEPIKTATCSFIQTNGVALSPSTGTEACLFSYLINTGCAYTTGKSKATGLFLMTGMKYLNESKEVVTVSESNINALQSRWFTENQGVPIDKTLANRHFMLAADLLSRMSYDSHPDADNLRKRRVDEANLIYDYCVGQKITFGESVLPSEIVKSAAKARGFFEFKGRRFCVHDNNAPALPEDPNDIEIVDQTGSNTIIGDMTKRVIRYIARQAGIRGVCITSLYRSPEKQGDAMFKNRQNANGGRPVSYAAPGRAVDAEYDAVSKKYYGSIRKIGDDHASEARNAMINKCKELSDNGTPPSKHGSNPDVLQAVDMGPNSMKARFHYTEEELKRFHIACYDAWKNKYLRAYFGPPQFGDKAKDPAFHIEVFQNPPSGYKTVPESGDTVKDVLPDAGTILSNANLENEAMFDAIFATDKSRT